jgi:hypothetical protein
MPDAMQLPGGEELIPHKEVDVTKFLNLKRAKHIGKVDNEGPATT